MTAPHYADAAVTLWHGDSRRILPTLPDCSVDAVCTDPPYELGFMGKGWDASGIAYDVHLWEQVLRVLKPGGHLLAFGGTRTWHRLTCAIEDAGFEIRDTITWMYGSGFPKSLDVGKAIDKAAGAERAVLGVRSDALKRPPRVAGFAPGDVIRWGEDHYSWEDAPAVARDHYLQKSERVNDVTAPATPDAARWQGWGTALKPASEPIVVARKPLAGTVAANVLEYGTGALNIDACRVAHASAADLAESTGKNRHADYGTAPGQNQVYGDYGMVPARNYDGTAGRWPANVVLTHPQADDGGDACATGCVPGCPVADLDAQSGVTTSAVRQPTGRDDRGIPNGNSFVIRRHDTTAVGHHDEGGASRFFPTFRYQAKAGTAQRPRARRVGERVTDTGTPRQELRCARCGKQRVNVAGSFCTCDEPDFQPDAARDGFIAHPTVKPLDLMRWLVRLVTPPHVAERDEANLAEVMWRRGRVLDLFAGSGTTGEACTLEGFDCWLIEREADYLPLIVDRLTRRSDPVAHLTAKACRGEPVDLGLFAGLDPEDIAHDRALADLQGREYVPWPEEEGA